VLEILLKLEQPETDKKQNKTTKEQNTLNQKNEVK